jgi:hypothetical protein
MSKSEDHGSVIRPASPSIGELREAYLRGQNITQLLAGRHPGLDRPEIIELAYDVQAGSYTKYALEYPEILKRYAREIFELARMYISGHDVILDCGTGELTTLSALSEHLPGKTKLLACDISLSRMLVGRHFDEAKLYQVGYAFEQSGDWKKRGPAKKAAVKKAAAKPAARKR